MISAIRKEGKAEQHRKDLEFLMKYGDANDKRKALEKMRSITWKKRGNESDSDNSSDSEASSSSFEEDSF